MSEPHAHDVVVVGAGPVGLVAALTLAQAGVDVALVEKRETLSAVSRASTIHPPTLEILDRLGVLEEVRMQGEVAERIEYRSPDGVFASFDMRDLAGETRFPYRLHLEQAFITPVLLRRLTALPNSTVLFGAEITGVQQSGDRVEIMARLDGRQVDLQARYLVAADGARSATRAALGLDFDGFGYPDKILRVMTDDDLETILPQLAPVSYLFNGERSISFLKMPDCWRVVLRVPSEVPEEDAMDERWILERLQDVLPAWRSMPRVVNKDVYGVSRRMASRYRHGRAYLVGDAAHITNTRGGMNMNCGIHDAATLSRAVVQAVSAKRPETVDTASDERFRVAREMLLPRTDRSVSGGKAWADSLKERASSKETARAYLRTAAMMDMLDRSEMHG